MQHWGAVSRLTFTQSESPLINLKFVKGNHGDGYNFDGKGRFNNIFMSFSSKCINLCVSFFFNILTSFFSKQDKSWPMPSTLGYLLAPMEEIFILMMKNIGQMELIMVKLYLYNVFAYIKLCIWKLKLFNGFWNSYYILSCNVERKAFIQ